MLCAHTCGLLNTCCCSTADRLLFPAAAAAWLQGNASTLSNGLLSALKAAGGDGKIEVRDSCCFLAFEEAGLLATGLLSLNIFS